MHLAELLSVPSTDLKIRLLAAFTELLSTFAAVRAPAELSNGPLAHPF